MERKTVEAKLKAAPKGEIEAVFSTFNVIDHDGDVTLPDAFENGTEVVISAYGHTSWAGELPVGRGRIKTTRRDARVVGQLFMDTDAGRETFTTLQGLGNLAEFSYGFDVLETGDVAALPVELRGARRVLAKLKVHEVSPVLKGAGVGTGLVSIKCDGCAAKGAPCSTCETRAVAQEYAKLLARQFRGIVQAHEDAERKDLARWPIKARHVARAEREAAQLGAKWAAALLSGGELDAPRIEWCVPPPSVKARGEAIRGDASMIWLKAGIGPAAALEVAAHEVGHAVGGLDEDDARHFGKLLALALASGRKVYAWDARLGHGRYVENGALAVKYDGEQLHVLVWCKAGGGVGEWEVAA